jgi:hypothetical protein
MGWILTALPKNPWPVQSKPQAVWQIAEKQQGAICEI